MSKRKVNLEEILLKNIKKIYTELKPVEDFCNRDRIIAINAMKEACRQALELAAEKADIKIINHREHCPVPIVDKQSILDLINLIE